MAPMYYRNAHAAVVCYDVSDEASFAKMKDWVDELRKNVESLPPADYDKMGYYDRWVISLTQTMIQRGVITTDELARKLAEVGKRGQTPFSRSKGARSA